MDILLNILAWGLCLAIGLPVFIFATEILIGLPKPPARSWPLTDIPVTRVLVPAHDEELGIADKLKQLLAQLPPGITPLVVADNCTDRTAEIARDLGIEVIERHDTSRRGKGYALAFGRDHMRSDPPECVIVVDADCTIERDDLAALAIQARRENCALQGINLLDSDPAAPQVVQISSFALAVRNVIRQQALSRLGAPALLTGTGMAFPWSLFEPLPLASGHLVEDLELGIALARAGKKAHFTPYATVRSRPASGTATLVQRARWEGGFLGIAREQALPLVVTGLKTGSWPLLWLGLHLTIPPMALLVLLDAAALAILTLLLLAGASSVPLVLLIALNLMLAVAFVGAWHKVGRPYLSAAAVLKLPLYALWKIPLYLKLARGGDKQWVRTERSS